VKVLSVVGNRPQFIKSAPLSVALREHGIEEIVLHTGQHYDAELSQVFFDELALDEPAYRLDLHTADPAAMRPPILDAIEDERPDWTLVYGDTNSTLAGAEAAAEAGVAVAHVEAGLRSGDWSMPEERNRVEVDRVAELLFAPDDHSADTLESEGVPGEIAVVGDVMLDATLTFAPIARTRGGGDGRYAVVTIHREANVAEERLRRLVAAINATGENFVFPVHPRTRAVIDRAGIELAATVRVVEPLGYLDMLALVDGARAVVTDSGGLQKEAYWLRVPCVTLRPSTEWVETVRAGANVLVDPDDPSDLAAAVASATFPDDAPQLYGDGHASERIAEALVRLSP
jgi:UDP-N-acetylglucosamine 2-epimerase